MPEYIPNTIVRLLENVPFDSTYSDTILFTSVAEQTNFMQGKAKYSFNNFTYQRVNSSVAAPRIAYSVRVPRVADDLYNCNYLMFQNSNYGSKWFYAFIKQVNYINPNNTEIIYEIDHWQTWGLNINILPCIVEREHSLTDEPFENLTPEPLDIPYYIQEGNEWTTSRSIYYIVVLATYSTKLPDVFHKADNYGYAYSGLWIYYKPMNLKDEVTNLIKQMDELGIGDSIVSIFMSFIEPKTTTLNVPIPEEKTTNISIATDSYDTYTFRNKKLCNYPFRVFRLKSGNGSAIDFKPELCNGEKLKLYVYESSSITPTVTVFPNTKELSRYELQVTYEDTYQCAWGSNVYANWVGYNGVTNALSAFANLTQIGMGASTGNIVSALSGGLGVSKSIINEYNKRIHPDIFKGNINSSAAAINANCTGISCYALSLDKYTAKLFDEFFDMYGYACNQLKKPNLTGREHWNYVKTNNCIIEGSIPVDSMDRIKEMFNSGIRFWHGEIVGDYSLSNKPIAEVN